MSSYGRLWLEVEKSEQEARKKAAALPPRAATELADLVLAAPEQYPATLVQAAKRIKRQQAKLADALVNWQTVLQFEVAMSSRAGWTEA